MLRNHGQPSSRSNARTWQRPTSEKRALTLRAAVRALVRPRRRKARRRKIAESNLSSFPKARPTDLLEWTAWTHKAAVSAAGRSEPSERVKSSEGFFLREYK